MMQRLPHRLVVAALATWVLVFLMFAGILERKTDPTSSRRVDAVIALGGDADGTRVVEAVQQFRRSNASRLLLFQPMPGRAHEPFRGELQPYLESTGLSPESIRVVTPARSTADEAAQTASLARRCGWRTITVVTSPYHTRRAGYLFRKALGSRVRVSVVASREQFRVGTWWLHSKERSVVSREWLRIAGALRFAGRTLQPEAVDQPC